jgi:hypothetical protein
MLPPENYYYTQFHEYSGKQLPLLREKTRSVSITQTQTDIIRIM